MKTIKKAPKPQSRRKQTDVVGTLSTQNDIDERVIAEVEDDSAWEAPVRVSRKETAIGLPPGLAGRAAFLAHLHRESSLESWVERVVRERVELEERALTEARRELATKVGT